MIEVNEYARTKDGVIDKVDALYEMIENTVHLENQKWFDTKNIVKHRKQLIDLIENKDILKVTIDKTIMFFGIDESTSDTKYKEIIKSIENGECELLEILTHQQFEANCYKVVGEEDERLCKKKMCKV
ncbi:MAG: hypothetical protein V8R81_08715 [Clostridia bacterium]|jgi:hypothetical protein